MAGESLKFVLFLEDKFSGSANKASGSLSKLESSLESTGAELGAFLGPMIAATAAVAALGVAALAGGAALALSASEAKQDTLDMLDAMLGSQEAAQETYKAIQGLGDSVAISQERGMDLARELSAAGITNKEALVSSIKSIGQVESVLGKEAGGKIQKILEKSQATGQFKLAGRQLTGTGIKSSDIEAELSKQLGVVPSVIHEQLEKGRITADQGTKAINAVLQGKFGALAEKQVMDIGSQLTRLKDNFMKLFEDVDTGPFLEAFASVAKVFDSSTESGKAFKFLVTGLFNGLFKIVAKVGPYITTFLKGMAIIGLKIYIALKPLIKTISDAFGGSNQSNVDSFAGFMSKLGDAIAFVVEATVPMLSLFVKAVGVFVEIESYLLGLVGSFYDAGSNIITGLVNGVINGAGRAVDAVKGVGQSMLDKFTGIFGIHSPSAVMAKMGGHLMGGLDKGIAANDGAPGASMAAAVSPSGVAARGGGGGTTQVTFTAGSIVITVAGGNASEVAAQLRQVLPGELAAAFESIGITAGAA